MMSWTATLLAIAALTTTTAVPIASVKGSRMLLMQHLTPASVNGSQAVQVQPADRASYTDIPACTNGTHSLDVHKIPNDGNTYKSAGFQGAAIVSDKACRFDFRATSNNDDKYTLTVGASYDPSCPFVNNNFDAQFIYSANYDDSNTHDIGVHSTQVHPGPAQPITICAMIKCSNLVEDCDVTLTFATPE